MQKIQNNKKYTKFKRLSIVFAIAMVAATVITSSVIGFQKPVISDLEQGQADAIISPEIDAPITDGEGNELENGEIHKMPRAMTFRSASALANNASYDSITLTATVKPVAADNKTVDWSVSFVDASSAWATGKTVTDYITVTPQSDGSTTATVQCLKDFGAQIKVTVTSRENAGAKAECTIDFAKRLTGITGKISGGATFDALTDGSFNYGNPDDTLVIDYTYTYSAYTVDDTLELVPELQINETVLADLNTSLTKKITIREAGYTKTETAAKQTCNLLSLFCEPLTSNPSKYVALSPATKNEVLTWLKTHTDAGLFSVRYATTGSYSSVDRAVRIDFDASLFKTYVEDVTLDDTAIII